MFRIGNLLLAFVAVVLSIGLFEIVCRTVVNTGTEYHIEMWKYAVRAKRVAADPEMGHEHVPGVHTRLMNVDVIIDSQGLRNREIAMPKPAGVQRILMLGDSIVFGWGVDQDKTMSVVLERKLNAAGAGPVEVINSGVGNYNSAMEVAYFRDHGLALSPDVVILNYFINDAEPTPVYHAVPWIARHSYIYPVLGGAWDDIKRRIFGGPDWREYYADLYEDRAAGWQKAQANIALLARICRAKGIRLILANVPELHVLKPYPFVGINAKLAALSAADGIEYVDLLPALEGEDPPALWVTVPDPHPDARAHMLMGEALASYLMTHPAPPQQATNP